MGCDLPGDVGRFIADAERMTERRNLCCSVDVRWHCIALSHRDDVAGHDLARGRRALGYSELRHRFKLLQIAFQFREDGVRLACQLGFEDGDGLRFAPVEDFISVTRCTLGRIKIWMFRLRLDTRFYVGVHVLIPVARRPTLRSRFAKTGPDGSQDVSPTQRRDCGRLLFSGQPKLS
jgi:hypothetical protein